VVISFILTFLLLPLHQNKKKFKVVRLPNMPPKLDPTSVHLIRSRSPSTSAFIEPTANGRCCVLFATSGSFISNNSSSNGRDKICTFDDLFMALPEKISSEKGLMIDLESTARDISEQFPLLDGSNFSDISLQLLSQRPRSVFTVKCNVYHVDSFAALVGDAAHATGGVSGQGCNSALVDSATLANELYRCFTDESCLLLTKEQKIRKALVAYSQKQVPEGQALFDLAFGETNENANLCLKIWISISSLVDTVFGGKFGIGRPSLQKLLTTSLVPFSKIRRDRGDLYTEKFPSDEYFNKTIASLC
jgi:kynurenine 3-monooxygenase